MIGGLDVGRGMNFIVKIDIVPTHSNYLVLPSILVIMRLIIVSI